MLEALQEMAGRLQQQFPSAVITLEPMGPNDLTLDVVLGDQLLVLDWFPEGFGVTLVTENKSFTRGCDVAFTDAADAEEYLVQQLKAIAGVRQED